MELVDWIFPYFPNMKKWLGRFYLKFYKWRILGDPPMMPKYVIAVAPHTSNRDFFLGLAVRAATGIKAHFLGKSQLFYPPYGWIFRALGGYPVDRSKHHGMVESVISIFNSKETFSIAISPEGTRKAGNTFRTGFYHIAKGAGVPIIRVGFDYHTKSVIFDEPFVTTDNTDKDLAAIREWFRQFQGYYPEKGVV